MRLAPSAPFCASFLAGVLLRERAMPRPSAADEEHLVQLATRISKKLHQAVKLYCVQNERSMAEFVTAALRDKLTRARKR